MNQAKSVIAETVNQIMAWGYDDVGEYFEAMSDLYQEMIESSQTSVCASVTLQFEQTMVMTRQAFRGTLSLTNGNTSTPMTDIKLALKLTDEDGNIATSHEFQINAESITGMEGELSLDTGWTLAADSSGKVTVLFIPTRYAAETLPKLYDFGGTVSYIDPFTGLLVTRELTPVTLTVNPAPVLDLTYFMQRDVYGDDPMTTDVVEPMEPAEFSLLINNTGYGDATNVRMVTNQPRIIENEKGLYVDFEIQSAQLNGKETTLALGSSVATDFGTIAAGSTAYAQWWFTSTLTGHFVDYEVTATHVTSYDNPDLTLLDNVTIHELIHSIIIDESDDIPLMGFITNDLADAEDLPDHIYLTDGSDDTVTIAEASSWTKIDDCTYRLTITPDFSGWTYGYTNDPCNGNQEVVSVTRDSDGASINTRNFWLTDRVLSDGADALYENRLHYADYFESLAPQSYTIVFSPRPKTYLEVSKFLSEYNGNAFPSQYDVVTTQLKRIEVVFNKAIDASTFTVDDIKLCAQGEVIDSSLLSVVEEDGHYYIDLSRVPESISGYFVLTVQTAAITDYQGYTGQTGKTASWVYYTGETFHLSISASDDNAGTVNLSSGDYTINSSIDLEATENPGWRFRAWEVNGEEVSTETTYSHPVICDAEIVARYETISYYTEISYDSTLGTIKGAITGSGYYGYGTQIALTATPFYDALFLGWKVDDQIVTTDNSYTLTVNANHTISPYFQTRYTSKTISLTPGWNWISIPDDEFDLERFLNLTAGKIVTLESDAVTYTYISGKGWVGAPPEIVPGKSYRIYLSDAMSYTWTSLEPIVKETPIALSQGWNWIGYTPAETLAVNDALKDLTPAKNDVLKDYNCFAIYDGSSWVGSLTTMSPGVGYHYYSTLDDSFTYSDDEDEAKSSTKAIKSVFSYYDPQAETGLYPDNMTIIVNTKDLDGTVVTSSSQEVLCAFVDNECRGVGRYIDDTHIFLTIYGTEGTPSSTLTRALAAGEISFEAVLPGSYFVKINESASFTTEPQGTLDDPIVLTRGFQTNTDNIQADAERRMFSVRPNPVTDRLFIIGIHECIRHWTLTTTNGTLVDRGDTYHPDAGIDVSRLSPQLYILNLDTAFGPLDIKVIKR
ncbi:MAG: hypothetical protein LIP02_11440 [Bacteroidales bacterium]|nr:hypothetical protein [Bacteroidales bacterium]